MTPSVDWSAVEKAQRKDWVDTGQQVQHTIKVPERMQYSCLSLEFFFSQIAKKISNYVTNLTQLLIILVIVPGQRTFLSDKNVKD